ncbi:M16 family metallopeptidase [Piscinibacter sakaiensis]|uniref:M16 family metallopeptidase n=1 Tax=Piscinibacter sakaiensis TaxID=1547922 RepID=UPI003AAF0776
MSASLSYLPVPGADSDRTEIATLANGVRVVTIRLPASQTCSVSIYVRSGSQHESRRHNGISHFVEHMAFKGTDSRTCQQINFDAEQLGAEVNAHTDKDHTAFHMSGLACHAGDFIGMLGDIVRNGSFPEDELERERQVILQEFDEDADDAVSAGFKLFDRLCFGSHAFARPVIGTRPNIERFSRDELVGYVRRQYSGANVVVAVAGDVDPQQMVRAAEAAFGSLQPGADNGVEAPQHIGGIGSRHFGGYSQAHLVVGFPIPSLREAHHAAQVAAALFGEGMSSPLLDQLRERRGMVYHAACSADITEACGQFVIEASTTPAQLDDFFAELSRLLLTHASSIAPHDLARARNQITVRSLRASERPAQRVENAAQDVFAFGRVRSRSELLDQIHAVEAAQVRQVFAQMLARPAAVAVTGRPGHAIQQRVSRALAALPGQG